MLHQYEEALNQDYKRAALRVEVERILKVRDMRNLVGGALIFIIYVFLAIWIGYVTKDVQDTNTYKKEVLQEQARVVAEEARTDSIKRSMIYEFNKKYDKSLKKYYGQFGKSDQHGTTK